MRDMLSFEASLPPTQKTPLLACLIQVPICAKLALTGSKV